MQILYRDAEIVAINKSPGDLVQSSRGGESTLLDLLAAEHELPGLRVVHRLDRPVSGVVIFARTRNAAAGMSELFQRRVVEKRYWAVVDAIPGGYADGSAESGSAPASGRLVHRITTDRKRNLSRAWPVDTGHATNGKGRVAELRWRLVGSSERYHFLEIEPITGRQHQIRVQLSAAGSQVKGDVKYGSHRTNRGGGIHLHARSLSFPWHGRRFVVVADPPADPLWQLFLETGGTKTPDQPSGR